ncbi:tRNA modification GTPase trmE [Syntrophobotulus glycolicus DSM 8271]|uniref:tRNA modification GTPase MnmE n=1 Tax=Syntrophobotulus glycolicus (strain DSM 8271 / FlGlyR) TaxID=645991 RepID=F0T2Z0_SYNGF|nr:tRNA uridine-5-carboxymethylaminomethyl(34) synthesis GTPase MnmE [Syntrophobotulus glycolicus]ADY57627.1 tRNA modification GTPase trmE [Syntrophobotulus glycolicus DSM 8271]
MLEDTIVALATPPGEGGIHIVRLSGRGAGEVINHCFQPVNSARWQTQASHTLHLGWFFDGETKIDQVLLSRMLSPFSYTGEDVFEINCHGGMIPVRRIIEACLHQGARLAGPGEFSKRAFLNGKMDLVQAEAIIDLISSKSELSADLAVAQLDGALSDKVQVLRQEILDILSFIEAAIDFSEDEIDLLTYSQLEERIKSVRSKTIAILNGSKTGKIIREGLSTVIAGIPNVGKSSLLNALLREERAIVTDIPGTTRDEIREYVKIGGVLLHLIDTAGIRKSNDPVEMIGINRSWKAIDEADVVLLLLDVTDKENHSDGCLTEDELRILKDYAEKTIILYNKIDLLSSYHKADFLIPAQVKNQIKTILFSAKKRIGFKELEAELEKRVFGGDSAVMKPMLSNLRQISEMKNCLNHLDAALNSLALNIPIDLLSIDIRASLECISRITGNNVQEDLLTNIFTRFCIGK